jgi:dihydrofolate reductase
MTNILYMAISEDGFIAGPNDETPWSDEEWEEFSSFVSSCDAVLMGRRTFEIMRDSGDFIDGPQYIVATKNKSFDAAGFETRSISSITDIPVVEKLGIIGGGNLNGFLASIKAIDEVILDKEPITLGSGISLFGNFVVDLEMELLDAKTIGTGTIQEHYKVKK